MKKKIISFVFILMVAGVSVAAYFLLQPCKTHNDRNGDGYCDRCGEHFNIIAVYYHEYGAVGDGVTNDYLAIKKAHEVANQYGVPVYGDFRKTYRIASMADENGKYEPIPIKTDVDWKGCKFIFDDTNIGYNENGDNDYKINIFTIENDYKNTLYNSSSEIVQKLNENTITTETTWLNLDLGYPALLVLYNSDQKHFIRYGSDGNEGSDQQEIVLIDQYGNIDTSTPILCDYDKVTSVRIIRTDVKPITVQNATIESKASKVNLVNEYHTIYRGIAVNRSNVTIKNIYHEITGEIPKNAVVDSNSNIVPGYTYNEKTGKITNDATGAEVTNGTLKPFWGHSYGGIIQSKYCNNLLIEGVTFQARVTYQSSYDLNISHSNNVTLKNCDQNNFYYQDDSGNWLPNISDKCWGVSASSYCKNYTFDSCKLTRFDAHCGVYNAKIINSEIARIEVIGNGDLLFQNTKIHHRGTYGVILLKSDYGATFNGTITMKDCEVILYNNVVPKGIIQASSANHDFGYTTYFPNVVIDNLKFTNLAEGTNLSFVQVEEYIPGTSSYRYVDDPNIHIAGATCVDGKTNINPYVPPTRIELKNNAENEYNIMLYDVPFFASTTIIGNIQRVSV